MCKASHVINYACNGEFSVVYFKSNNNKFERGCDYVGENVWGDPDLTE